MKKIANIAKTPHNPNVFNILSGAYGNANTLTGLIPDLHQGMDVVSRELVGFIPSVFRDSSAERAAVGQPIVYHITPAATTTDISPSMTVPEPTDKVIGYGNMTISKSKKSDFGFIGEEQRGLNSGPGYRSVQADLFAQALRALVNEIEVDVATVAAMAACRAHGTAGTTPFASSVADTAQLGKILDDNGCPLSDRSLIIDSAAGAALRTLEKLTKVNEAGTAMTLRDGELLNLNRFSIKESAGILTFTKGTNNGSASTNNAGYAKGATTFTLASAGTGTILAGDYITFAGDTNKYLVTSGDADVSGGGSITIALPGLRQAIPASNTAITTVGSSVRNIGFTRTALHLVTRAPALPVEGDAALDRMMMTDPRSGLVFEVSLYAGYRKILAEVAMAWGQEAVKPAHIAALLG
jgi:hypothetical protein